MIQINLTKNIAIGFSTDYFCFCEGFTIIEFGFDRDRISFAFLGLHVGINFNITEYV